MKNPLVSVIIPTYNREKYLKSAMDSVLYQKGGNFELELIIVDDGSTDGTEKLIDKYGEKVIYKKIQHWGGPAKPRNVGLEMSRGEFIAFLDSDDTWLPEKLSKQIGLLKKNIDIVYTNANFIDKNGNNKNGTLLREGLAKSGHIFNDLVQENFIPLSSVLMRRRVYKKIKGFTENRRVGFEDYQYWLRASAKNYNFKYVDETLINYRLHGNKYSEKVMGGNGEKDQLIRVFWAIFRNTGSPRQKKILLKRIARLRLSNHTRIKNTIKQTISAPNYIYTRNKIKKYIQKMPVSSSGKRNVLFLIPWMTIGGADKVYLDLVKNLDKSKFRFFFVTTEYGEPNLWEKQFAPYASNITHLPDLTNLLILREYFMKLYIQKCDINQVIVSNTLEGYKLLPTIRSSYPQVKILDILHGQSGASDNGGSPEFSNPFDEYIDIRITVSDYLKDYMISKYEIDPTKIAVIHNGIDPNQFKPKPIKNVRGKDQVPVVTWLGRLSVEKQPLVFLEAISQLNKKYPSDKCKFILAGDGKLMPDVKKYIDNHKLGSIVSTPGFVKDTIKLLQETDILVMTSEMEGLPIVLLEAGSMNIPVLAPAVGGIPEIVKNGKNGYLVGYKKKLMANQLTEKLHHLLNNSIQRTTMGTNGRKIIVNDFNIHKITKEYERILL